MASSKRCHSICVIVSIMNTPTSTSAGAVAIAGTSDSSGDRNRNGRKHRPATTATSPVRPPAEMPAADSIYVFAGLVPSGADTSAEKASTIIDWRMLRGLPCSS